MNLKKVSKVLFVDVFGILVGVMSGFLIPKALDIEGYSFLKTFSLYATYAGVFHFGFSDGIYILLGGKCREEVDKEKIKGYYNFILKSQLIVVIVLILISSLIIKDKAFIYFSYYILPFQVTLFIRLYYRAIGEFDYYSSIQAIINVMNLLATLIVAFIYRSPKLYIFMQIFSYVTATIIFSYIFCKSYKKGKAISFKEIKQICAIGITVMLGNTLCSLFFSLDRWFIKAYFSSYEFASYSYAVSMLNLFIVLITSIGILFYPYISRNINNFEIRRKAKDCLLLISILCTSGYFVLELITDKFLSKYSGSMEVMGILILSLPFIALTNVLYSNLYKASKQGKKYLVVAVKMFIIAFMLNSFFTLVIKNSTMIAYATLISFAAWYLYGAKDFKGIEIYKREIFMIAFYISVFSLLRYLGIKHFIGFIIYLFTLLVAELLLYRKEVEGIKLYLMKKLNW
ncbi:oligosaccharide flippase family protein [Desnuesiella massiliensis]|uniref:oligosaccharide flippase family protein n=1 Tax=Desnuesiella massiliensis TaxID=1650662 RepID=UPI0006E224D6|nr:oligosaccharide flippase family protein [Desnuesiella massiliensis]